MPLLIKPRRAHNVSTTGALAKQAERYTMNERTLTKALMVNGVPSTREAYTSSLHSSWQLAGVARIIT